ncbi:unnamed protein product [Staurois parvus]|uniref:Uncharacterized protein n=1 Tax=Staurois parvus TaxID=386267 RepID=A0ABN9B1U0_9NEOB|nr:unnamed protein product [Staurois parvus]
MTRETADSTGDDQRLRTTVQEMTRDCGHSTGDDQRLWTVQEMDQTLRTRYRG